MQYIKVKPDELYHHGILGMKWGVRRYQNADGSLTAAGRDRYGSGDGTVSKKDQKTSWRAKRMKKIQEKAAKKEAEAKEKARQEAEDKRYSDIDEIFDDAKDAWDASPEGQKALDEYWEVHERVFNAEHATDKMWDEFDKAEEKYLRAMEQEGIKAIRKKFSDDDIIFYANNLYNTRWNKQTTHVDNVKDALKFIEDRWEVHRE